MQSIRPLALLLSSAPLLAVCAALRVGREVLDGESSPSFFLEAPQQLFLLELLLAALIVVVRRVVGPVQVEQPTT